METITPVNTYVYKLKLQLSFNLESIAALSVVSFAQCHYLKFCDGNFSRLLFFDRHGYVSLKASFPLSSRCDVSCFIIIFWERQTFSIRIGRYFHSKQVKQKQTKTTTKKSPFQYPTFWMFHCISFTFTFFSLKQGEPQ